MRRLFIIRKDLHLSPGKLAAMVGHAVELYWLNVLRNAGSYEQYGKCGRDDRPTAQAFEFSLPYAVWTDYINGIYTKTICESRNLNNLMKAKTIADELGLKVDEDYGFINDKCLTELKPENDDGTTTVGMWFAPLDDDTAHKISQKYPLLRDHSEHQEVKGESNSRYWVIKCNTGRYLCRSALGAIPKAKNIESENVWRASSKAECIRYLDYPGSTPPEYRERLKGATIEEVVERRILSCRPVEAKNKSDSSSDV